MGIAVNKVLHLGQVNFFSIYENKVMQLGHSITRGYLWKIVMVVLEFLGLSLFTEFKSAYSKSHTSNEMVMCKFWKPQVII